jgi:hypothetical protein
MQPPTNQLNRLLINVSLVFIATTTVLGTVSGGIGKLEPDRNRNLQSDKDLEIRFEFYPTGPYDDSVVPLFMVIGLDGDARALRYQLRDRTRNVAAYEGRLPEAEAQRLFARVRAAFRLPRHRKDYERKLIYESDGFYLALKQHRARIKEMSGSLETRPEEVRALVKEMSELWKRLSHVQAAFAYLTVSPIEKDRLRQLSNKYKVTPSRIESLPGPIQSLLIPVVTESRNFYPLTEAQYDQLQPYLRPMTYKGSGYEPMLLRSTKEGLQQ